MVERHDLVTDESIRAGLFTARRGTAFFGHKLGELSHADLDEPTLLAGWTRRHVIAHVGYNAQALARLVEWASTGVENLMYPSPQSRIEEIERGATLPPIALLNLFEHSANHLSLEWRDLPDSRWAAEVRTAQGRLVPVSETVWMRTREVWLHAVDLHNGARFDDIPGEVLRRLLGDIWDTWEKRGSTAGLALRVVGDDADGLELGVLRPDTTLVEGGLASVVRWAAGRGAEPGGTIGAAIGSTHTDVPSPPLWI